MNILDRGFLRVFESFPPQRQREGVDMAKAYIERIQNGTPSQRRELGVTDPTDDNTVLNVVDSIRWQLVQLLKYSTPTRIDEAAPYIESCIAHYARSHPGKPDVTPLLTLGVALHKAPGKEQQALVKFRQGFDACREPGANSALWARGAMSRLLRRLGRVEEAEREENWLRYWIHAHPFAVHWSKFTELVTDPAERDTGARNYILDHPDMADFDSDYVALNSGISVHMI